MKDIFNEDKFIPMKGLVRRYKDRALLELTLSCPVRCTFCYKEWKNKLGKPDLNKEDVNKIIKYILKNKEIDQIILSGGEPLMNLEILEYCLNKFGELKQIKTFRIHSRAPVTAPELVNNKFLEVLSKKYKQVIYFSVHVNQIEELNEKTEEAIEKIRKTGVILYSQSVLLKGINNSVCKLEMLFKRLMEIGVRPYNLYKCNKIKGLERYFITIEEAMTIMTELRKNISGFCCPNLIVDVPGSADKIPVPLKFWKVKMDYFYDFEGNKTKIVSI